MSGKLGREKRVSLTYSLLFIEIVKKMIKNGLC
jgi:hypothetical protein